MVISICALEAFIWPSSSSSRYGWSFIILLTFFLPQAYIPYHFPSSGGGVYLSTAFPQTFPQLIHPLYTRYAHLDIHTVLAMHTVVTVSHHPYLYLWTDCHRIVSFAPILLAHY